MAKISLQDGQLRRPGANVFVTFPAAGRHFGKVDAPAARSPLGATPSVLTSDSVVSSAVVVAAASAREAAASSKPDLPWGPHGRPTKADPRGTDLERGCPDARWQQRGNRLSAVARREHRIPRVRIGYPVTNLLYCRTGQLRPDPVA